MTGLENFGERMGDEEPDAKVGDFQVYGGSYVERQQLQDGGTAHMDAIEAELQEMLRRGTDE